MARIGIIGGSGLYQMDSLTDLQYMKIDTPFGDPSDEYLLGTLHGQQVVFLPRHGRGHRLLPTEVNNRANIYGMKLLEVDWIISVSAVGSFQKELKPMDIVLIDQFFDRTNQARANTFFGHGIVAHIQFAHPLCPNLRQILHRAGQESGATIKFGGTYLNMEGPAFSTLAESTTFQAWGMDVIGMTQMNEAKLAREAEICYATLAMVTDYDCWWEEETGQTVTVDIVLENLQKNTANAAAIIDRAVSEIPHMGDCGCRHALQNAIMTEKSLWPKDTADKLLPILHKYM